MSTMDDICEESHGQKCDFPTCSVAASKHKPKEVSLWKRVAPRIFGMLALYAGLWGIANKDAVTMQKFISIALVGIGVNELCEPRRSGEGV